MTLSLPEPAAPSVELLARIERVLGARVVSWRFRRGGYSLAHRWALELAGGDTAFAKLATTPDTARFLRAEQRVYGAVAAPFMPRVLAWEDDPDAPVLVLEDLSRAHWPPPWSPEQIARVQATLADVGAHRAPEHLPSIEDGFAALYSTSSEGASTGREGWGWATVARDPRPFLALGVCTPAWFERAAPALVAAESRARLAGEGLLHADVRGDNLCFDSERTLLVDWNWAARGNPLVDVAFWLPSLALDGGPAPSEVLPHEGELAAFVSGFFASQAGLPRPAGAPTVRAFQLAQLQQALPWCTQALGIEGAVPGA